MVGGYAAVPPHGNPTKGCAFEKTHYHPHLFFPSPFIMVVAATVVVMPTTTAIL